MWKKTLSFPSPIEGEMQAFTNDAYIVAFHPHLSEQLGVITHAIIWRIDAQEIGNWDELQRIKNEVFGPESWAYEVYPAESCKVAVANARHLWLVATPLPFGYRFRATGFDQPKLFEAAKVVW